jgi:hypothetical protein
MAILLLYIVRNINGNISPRPLVLEILSAIWINFKIHGNLYLHCLLDCQPRDEC